MSICAISPAPDPQNDIATIGPRVPPITALSMRTDRITIGPVLPEDTGDLFLWLNDVESASLDLPYRPVDWMSYNSWLADITKGPSQVLFAIRRVIDPKIIGFLALTKIHTVHRAAEFGVRIGCKADRAKGYGTEATGLALRYAWDHLNLNRVYLSVFAFNRHAIGAYEAAGFQHEGKQKQAAFINGNWTDVILMAALRPAKSQTDGSYAAWDFR